MKILCIISISLISALAVTANAEESPNSTFSPYVDKQGNITRPTNVREKWTHLGSWYVPEEEGAPGPGIHDVYAEPSAVIAFNKTGKWPDGATLVKEVRNTDNAVRTTGKAHWATDVGVWFVMVKDNNQRFEGDARWGGGWGWALFKSDQPNINVTKNWKGEGFNNCFGCHIPAKNTGWVYLEGYPTLKLTDEQKKYISER